MAPTRMITVVVSLAMVMFHSPSSSVSYTWPHPSSHRILIEIALINPLDFNNVWLQLLSPLDCNLNDSTIVDPKTQVLILLPVNYPKFSPPPTVSFLPADQKPTYFGELKRRYQTYLSTLPAEMRRFLIDVDPCKTSTAAKSSIRSEVTSNELRKLQGYIQRQNDKLRKEYQNALENMAEAYLQLEKNVSTLTETVHGVEVSLEKSRIQLPRNVNQQTFAAEISEQTKQPAPELYFNRINDWLLRFDGFRIILITFILILVAMIFLLSLLVLVLLCCHQAAGGVHGKDRSFRNHPAGLQHQYHLHQKPESG